MSSRPVDGILLLRGLAFNSTEEQIKDMYNKWAVNYEKDSSLNGYVGHKTCCEIFDAEMRQIFEEGRLNKRVLDAGAGTGIVGQNLKDFGYTNVDGLDISQEMLNIARDKGVYQNLICAPLSEKRIEQIQTWCYDALISSAVITVGHVKAQAFDEIVRLVKPGGVICFTLRQDAYDTDSTGYKKKIDEIVAAKKWEIVNSELISYYVNPGERSELEKCYLFSCKVLN